MQSNGDPVIEALEVVEQYDTARTAELTKYQSAIFKALENGDIETFSRLERVANNVAKQGRFSLEEKQWLAETVLQKVYLEADVKAFLANRYCEYQEGGSGTIHFKEKTDAGDISDFE